MTSTNSKLNCSCDKDARFNFACKEGVKWFTTKEILFKISKKKKKEGDQYDASELINEEYEKCKKHYRSLKKLEPRHETVVQIERDLKRTFPKNEFFKSSRGQKKLRNVLRAFSCYDNQADYV